jgi:multicomponent Na+:H+ antiporter subunit G
MIETAADILSWICFVTGTMTIVIGAVGMLRLPDLYARMHGAGIIDTLGIALVLLGLLLQAGFTIVAVKLVLILIFIFYTSPVTTHALARAAIADGQEPVLTETEADGGPSSKP